MSRIRVSEKHGINPSLLICPYCGEDTGVALVGKLPNDAEAPRKMSGDPCDDCQAKIDKSIMIIEVDGSSQMPDGRAIGIARTHEFVSKEFLGEKYDEVHKSGGIYIDTKDWDNIGLPSHEDLKEELNNADNTENS